MNVANKVAENVRGLTGNQAAAHAARLARIGAGLFFPIGPSDEVMETVRRLIDNGELTNAEVLQLENEKANVSCQIALTRLGVRTMLSTCAEGLIWPTSEIRYAANSRLPLLIVNPTRSISPPTTIGCDHDDFMIQRDMGWLMFFAENPQDVLDTILQAYRVAEDKEVMLPAIVGYDGYGGTSHATWGVSLPEQEKVDKFLPRRVLRPDKDYLAIDWYERFKHRRYQHMMPETYMDKKYVMIRSLNQAKEVIEKVGAEYKTLFGRPYGGLLETYYCQGADIAIVTMGHFTQTCKFVVGALREEGMKVGIVKLRAIRPFPSEALAEALKDAKVVLTIERNSLEVLFSETKAALYESKHKPIVMGRVTGIGGRESTYMDIAKMIDEAFAALKQGKPEKVYDWAPIWSLDFDPFEEDVGE